MSNEKLLKDIAKGMILLLNNTTYSGEVGASQDPRQMAQDIKDDLEEDAKSK